ncbi:MAG: hypothetical protein K1X66_05790 [Verrucomicrobiae bacterium]|nr:hypothetical protein [Verrucomicrobiae bacterium]
MKIQISLLLLFIGLCQSTWSAINDNFANRIPLVGLPVTAQLLTNTDATVEAGEPQHAGLADTTNSVWWTWTAPANGDYAFLTLGSDFDTVLALYEGNAVNMLTTLASNNDANLGGTNIVKRSYLHLNLTNSQTVQIAVSGTGPDKSNKGQIKLQIAQRPINDDFANAQPLSGPTLTTNATTLGASKESSEPQLQPTAPGSASIWWQWSPPTNGSYVVSTEGTGFDSLLGVYTGNSLNALTQILRANNTSSNLNEIASFQADANTTYFITVDGNGPLQFGNVVLSIYPGAVENFIDPNLLGLEISIRAPKNDGKTYKKRARRGVRARAKFVDTTGTNTIKKIEYAVVSGTNLTNSAIPNPFISFEKVKIRKKGKVARGRTTIASNLPSGEVRLEVRAVINDTNTTSTVKRTFNLIRK